MTPVPDFPSELVEAAAKTLAGEPRCYCPDDWRADPSTRCPFHGDGEWPTYAHYRRARAVLAAVLPLVQQHVRNEDDLAIAMWGAGVVLPPVDQDELAKRDALREAGEGLLRIVVDEYGDPAEDEDVADLSWLDAAVSAWRAATGEDA